MIDVSAACCIRMRRANDLASRKPLAQRTTDGLCAAESIYAARRVQLLS